MKFFDAFICNEFEIDFKEWFNLVKDLDILWLISSFLERCMNLFKLQKKLLYLMQVMSLHIFSLDELLKLPSEGHDKIESDKGHDDLDEVDADGNEWSHIG